MQLINALVDVSAPIFRNTVRTGEGKKATVVFHRLVTTRHHSLGRITKSSKLWENGNFIDSHSIFVLRRENQTCLWRQRSGQFVNDGFSPKTGYYVRPYPQSNSTWMSTYPSWRGRRALVPFDSCQCVSFQQLLLPQHSSFRPDFPSSLSHL